MTLVFLNLIKHAKSNVHKSLEENDNSQKLNHKKMNSEENTKRFFFLTIRPLELRIETISSCHALCLF